MLQNTNGIVLRSVKYGDSSLVTTIFTATFGVQTYMVQGVRNSKSSKAGFFQSGMLLELVVYQQPQKNLQRIREFQAAYIYEGLQDNVIKNSIVIFSVEILLRLLPEQAPMPALFEFACQYMVKLDNTAVRAVGNFPLYFVIQCGRAMGYELRGSYGPGTPHLNLQEGGFTEQMPAGNYSISEEDGRMLDKLLSAEDYASVQSVDMSSGIRLRLLDWFIAFLQTHTGHMGNIRSLSVIRTILH